MVTNCSNACSRMWPENESASRPEMTSSASRSNPVLVVVASAMRVPERPDRPSFQSLSARSDSPHRAQNESDVRYPSAYPSAGGDMELPTGTVTFLFTDIEGS